MQWLATPRKNQGIHEKKMKHIDQSSSTVCIMKGLGTVIIYIKWFGHTCTGVSGFCSHITYKIQL